MPGRLRHELVQARLGGSGGLSLVTFVALGDVDDCAVLSVGIIKCWEGNNITKTAPVVIAGL